MEEGITVKIKGFDFPVVPGDPIDNGDPFGFKKFKEFLGIKHSGGTISQTGPYILQRGETVIPAGDGPGAMPAGVGGGFAFNVTTLNIFEKDDREVKDVAFAVTATMNNEVRRRGYLLSSSPPTTSTGVIRARP